MFAVIDCGTTTTRIYIIGENREIVAAGRKKIGVRDTSITGSRDALRNGVTELFYSILKENNLANEDVSFAIASGMITSEVGLIEIPHLVAPVGIKELSEGIMEVTDQSVLPIGRPVYFVRGVRNNYGEKARAQDLRNIDFMRGEEVQCVGIMERQTFSYPSNIVALSSHTKVMCIDAQGRIAASNTTISGQFYEALVSSTNLGKSITPVEGEEAGGYTEEELIEVAFDCVRHAGLGRTMLMPRFLQVLLKTNSNERRLFIDAAIAADDMRAFHEMRDQGYTSDHYIFYGHKERCLLYTHLLRQEFGEHLTIDCIYDPEEIDRLTVDGVIAVALNKVRAFKREE